MLFRSPACEVERSRDVLGVMIAHQFAQHRDEDVDSVSGVPFLIRQASPAKRVIGAVHLRAAVDEKNRGAGHPAVELFGKDIIGF